ncbi:MAG: hypothetical protein JSS30_04640 [Verrucomicrobia bacterium]|nr:hypothetical protein [Verrucomicrobiota bacterium]
MFKKWIAKGLAIALCSAPLCAADSPYSYSGQQIVAEVEATYQKGEYEIFLEQLDEQYQRAGKAGVLRGVFESAKAVMPVSATVKDQKEYRSELAKLDKERNEQLLDAIGNNKDSAIGQKIEEISSYKISQEQIEVLAELDTLKYQVPQDTKATIDNKIAALEVEFYIKSLLLDIASQKSGSSAEELNKKKIALALQKLDRMEEAAKDYDDEIWMKKIALAKEGFRADKAYKMDVAVLKELAAGNINPENPVEEKVKGIMIDFLSQRTAKTDQFIASLENNS